MVRRAVSATDNRGRHRGNLNSLLFLVPKKKARCTRRGYTRPGEVPKRWLYVSIILDMQADRCRTRRSVSQCMFNSEHPRQPVSTIKKGAGGRTLGEKKGAITGKGKTKRVVGHTSWTGEGHFRGVDAYGTCNTSIIGLPVVTTPMSLIRFGS